MAVVVVVRSKKSKCMNHPMAHKTGTVVITFNHEILKKSTCKDADKRVATLI